MTQHVFHLGQQFLAQALKALDPGPILAKVPPQAPGRYAGWPVERWSGAQLSVFALGPRTTIPLHDHPGMHVLTRVLRGRAALVAYDWVDRECLLAANRVASSFVPEAPVWLTEPERSNLHALETHDQPCVFLDLFLPYYDEGAGRRCSYYEVRARPADPRKPTPLTRRAD